MAAHKNLHPGQFQSFVPDESRWLRREAPKEINSAIDSYPSHISSESAGETRAPYDAASMAEIYHPRVKQLLGMQARGATHAAWGSLRADSGDRWHPVSADTPEIKNPLNKMTPFGARTEASKIRGRALS